jgi:hypothetical protein
MAEEEELYIFISSSSVNVDLFITYVNLSSPKENFFLCFPFKPYPRRLIRGKIEKKEGIFLHISLLITRS